MPDPRVEFLTIVRAGLVVIPLLTGTVVPHPMGAQQPTGDVISSSVTFMQPLTRSTPRDLAQRLVVDPSPHAFAPWAAVGFRWAWEAALDGDAHPIGTLGLRFQRRSLRVALGVSRDAAYSRIDVLNNSRRGSSLSPIPPGATCDVIIPPDKRVCMPPTSADSNVGAVRAGYTMQSVTDVTGSAEWGAGRIAVGLETGWRLAGPATRRLWYSATVATPLAPMFALVAGVDRRYEAVWGSSAARMTLGLQWRWGLRRRSPPVEPRRTPNHAAVSANSLSISEGSLVVHRLPSGVRLSLLAASAGRVEIRSDLTSWTAMPMARGIDGRWQLDLAASPGVHQLAMRLDGGDWLPPPGLSVSSDGYGGIIGLFVVEP